MWPFCRAQKCHWQDIDKQDQEEYFWAVLTHTLPCNCPLSGTTQVSRYKKGKTNLEFNEARDSEWQWHQLCHMQVCTSLQTDNHANTPPLSFLQAGCPFCCPTSSVKPLKAVQSTVLKYVNMSDILQTALKTYQFDGLENSKEHSGSCSWYHMIHGFIWPEMVSAEQN